MSQPSIMLGAGEIKQKQAGAETGKAQPSWGLAKLKLGLAEFKHIVGLGSTFSETHNYNP